ncbi:hypothetical protein F5Y19DRAFT_470526 [Xylariaceae sp. FL1651]|nr:hypothetical protein F5Y19DRAFT_470526 [Xylariaceae sp. FL1651]
MPLILTYDKIGAHFPPSIGIRTVETSQPATPCRRASRQSLVGGHDKVGSERCAELGYVAEPAPYLPGAFLGAYRQSLQGDPQDTAAVLTELASCQERRDLADIAHLVDIDIAQHADTLVSQNKPQPAGPFDMPEKIEAEGAVGRGKLNNRSGAVCGYDGVAVKSSQSFVKIVSPKSADYFYDEALGSSAICFGESIFDSL